MLTLLFQVADTLPGKQAVAMGHRPHLIPITGSLAWQEGMRISDQAKKALTFCDDILCNGNYRFRYLRDIKYNALKRSMTGIDSRGH
jgi:hypothetical protein